MTFLKSLINYEYIFKIAEIKCLNLVYNYLKGKKQFILKVNMCRRS